GGATRWCWFSRRPSIGGTPIGLFAAGGAVRDVLDDHASMCCVAISLGAWLRRIACGVRREFTANCSSSESSFQNAPWLRGSRPCALLSRHVSVRTPGLGSP